MIRKRLVVVLASFFTLAVLCASLAVPSASVARLGQHEDQPSGCAGYGSRLGDNAESNLNFLCTSDFSVGSFSKVFVISSSARDLFQNGLLLIAALSQWSSHDIDLALAGDRFKGFSHTYSARKVSTHLFNSVLTL